MAKLPALISVIGKYDPRGEATVENHARKLRAGGIMTTGKRGVGAPEMTSTDAVNLLLSMVSRRADEAASTVEALRNAKIEPGHHDLIREFSFYERTLDADGSVRAGLFFDALIEEYGQKSNVLSIDGKKRLLDRTEIRDPNTGFGSITFSFFSVDNEISQVSFNVFSDPYHDPKTFPEMQIQNSIVVDPVIILKVIETIRMTVPA